MANFRKRIKLFPGLHLNVSKSGISLSAGIPGLSVTTGKKGTYLNTGIPGTGIYERKKIKGGPTYSSSTEPHIDPTDALYTEDTLCAGIEESAIVLSDSTHYPISKEKMEAVVKLILQDNKVSLSHIQRHFDLGYAESGRVIDFLEVCGIVSGQNGIKPRDILAFSLDECYMKINEYISAKM